MKYKYNGFELLTPLLKEKLTKNTEKIYNIKKNE